MITAKTVEEFISKRDARILFMFEVSGSLQKSIAKYFSLSESRIKSIIKEQRKIRNAAKP